MDIPPKNQVVTHFQSQSQSQDDPSSSSSSPIGKHSFGTKCVAKTFCKTCGMHMTNVAADDDLDATQLAALTEEFKGIYQLAKQLTPVNLRVLNDFAVLAELKRGGGLYAGG